uniref:Ras-associating domain-containing protein n=1 Tax=Bionectria ochroleuca TaxID=29856 RepID=A0A8H7ND69_BIOOC
MDVTFTTNNDPERRESIVSPAPKGRWDAPDSWAVRRNTDDNTFHGPEMDEIQGTPRPDEKKTPYCIRIFRSDGTFSTHSMSLDASVADVISQVVKKTYVVDGIDNYHIIMKKQNLIRVLSPPERPLLIQKRLLQQVGYEDKDRIEDVGREDNTYLCRFMFLSAKESDFHSRTADLTVSRTQSSTTSICLAVTLSRYPSPSTQKQPISSRSICPEICRWMSPGISSSPASICVISSSIITRPEDSRRV